MVTGIFNSVSGVSDLHLPASVRQKIWRSGLVKHAPVMDIISKAVISNPSTEEEINSYIDDICDMMVALDHYKEGFFGPKYNVSPEVLYAVFGKGIIGMQPEDFPDLPKGYFELETQLEALQNAPELIDTRNISPHARFIHYLDGYMGLRKFLARIRETSLSPEEILYTYRTDGAQLKNIVLAETSLGKDIIAVTRQIDFMINHPDNDFSWHIGMSQRHGPTVFDEDWLYEQSPFPKANERLREVFKYVYSAYQNLFGEPGYDAFYAFSESVINPALSLFEYEPDATPKISQLIYAMVLPLLEDEESEYKAADFGKDIETLDVIKKKNIKGPGQAPGVYQCNDIIQSVDICHRYNSLKGQTLHLWGDRVHPKKTGQDMMDFYSLLKQTETVRIKGEGLLDSWNRAREDAILLYNSAAQATNVKSIPIYTPFRPS